MRGGLVLRVPVQATVSTAGSSRVPQLTSAGGTGASSAPPRQVILLISPLPPLYPRPVPASRQGVGLCHRRGAGAVPSLLPGRGVGKAGKSPRFPLYHTTNRIFFLPFLPAPPCPVL